MHGRRIGRVVLLFALVWGAVDAGAQRGRTAAFNRRAEIPDEGLVFSVTRGAEPVGLPQPEVLYYRSSAGEQEERFRPRDLWYPGVYLGRWEEASGIALTLGRLGPPPPVPLNGEPLTRARYEAVQAGGSAQPPQTTEEVEVWLAAFAGVSTSGPLRELQTGPRLGAALALGFEPGDLARVAYLFRFNRNVHGVDPDQWYVALFEGPADDGGAWIQTADREFVRSLGTMAVDRAAGPGVSDRFQRVERPAEEDRSAVFKESVQRAIDSIRGLPGWWYIETPHYVLVSDLALRERLFVNSIQNDLGTLRVHWERLIPPRRPIEAVSLVRVFSDPGDYIRYVGEGYRDTAGVWVPGRRELVVRSFGVDLGRERQAALAGIVYHEALHQYLFYAFELVMTSPWYNEGHATFFEGSDLRRDELRVTEVARYAERVAALTARGDVALEPFLYIDYDAFYQRGGDRERQRDHYAMAWGLIYYLRKVAPSDSGNTYETILPRYEAALWATRDQRQATQQAFEGVDLQAFISDWTAFWQSDTARRRAERNPLTW